MDVSPELSVALVGFIASMGGAYYVAKWRMDRFDTDFAAFKSDVWREVGKLRDFRHSHEKESSEERLKLYAEINVLKVSSGKIEEKFSAILERFDRLEEKIDRIETRDE